MNICKFCQNEIDSILTARDGYQDCDISLVSGITAEGITTIIQPLHSCREETTLKKTEVKLRVKCNSCGEPVIWFHKNFKSFVCSATQITGVVQGRARVKTLYPFHKCESL